VGCDAKIFRDGMVNNYSKTAISWANQYSPVLDVTETVRAVCPKVTKATLTIYGDDLARIKIVKAGSTKPTTYPDGRPADVGVYGDRARWNILHNWLAGVEFERQYCQEDGEWYWVIYPCKLEVQGTLTLPCVLNDFVQQDAVVDVTGIVDQYVVQPKVIRGTLTVYRSKPQKIIGPYDTKPDKYYDGRPAVIEKYGTEALKNIVENWMAGQEWERVQCSKTGKWYWVLYPCKLDIETEAVTVKRFSFKLSPSNPGLGETVTVNWTHTNGWDKSYKFRLRFLLVQPNSQVVQVYSKEYYLASGKSTSGSFTFKMPNLPGKYTLKGLVELYSGGWVEDESAQYSWVIPGTQEPSVQDFVNSLVSYYGSKTPTINVESKLKSTMNRKYPTYEYLDEITVFGTRLRYADDNYSSGGTVKLYLDRPSQIEVIEYGWDKPPDRYSDGYTFCTKVVKGWLEGYEMERMYSAKSGKWYWVKIPAEFKYNAPRATPILNIRSDGTVEFGVEGYVRVVAYNYDVGGYVTHYERPWGAKLFVDGKLVDQVEVNYDAWKAGQRRFTKVAKLPPLSTGYHTLTLILLRYSDSGFYAMSKQVYVTAPTIGWEASVDKTTVAAGDTLKIIAKVNWEAPGSLKFKLGIDAFGRHYESKEVTATTSPTIIEAPITVPPDVKVGEHGVKVELYAYY